MNRKQNQGFTLIEIAIVLVIIGLLLGGVLKGQELITSARVRNLISQQDGVKAAFFGFQDRFRALPGDYTQATTNIVGATSNGNGNGQVETAAVCGAIVGCVTQEDILVWEHLSRAGFINGSYTFAAAAPFDTAILKNPYSSYVQVVYGGWYGAGTAETGAGASPARHHIKSGSQVPVEIMAEVDRKIDDGDAFKGGFQFSGGTQYGNTAPPAPAGTGAANASATCSGTDGLWLVKNGVTNCQGASLL
jgi:prepilin-type N-terminal cleavage/methylation domain-containing protein